jgi:inorganic pyrophosphatase
MSDLSSIHVHAIEHIGTRVRFVIDRPRGTLHPDYPTLRYELDYGFVPNTLSADGEEMDAYILKASNAPCEDKDGLCVGAILRRDGDDKLVIVLESASGAVSAQSVRQLTSFQERFFWPEQYADKSGSYWFTPDGVTRGDIC